jgi:hypothetical protein
MKAIYWLVWFRIKENIASFYMHNKANCKNEVADLIICEFLCFCGMYFKL